MAEQVLGGIKMRRSRRRGLVKERILMVASAVLVLGSLTATGLWLGRDRSTQDEGYVVDLSAIENNTTAGLGHLPKMISIMILIFRRQIHRR